MQYTSEAGPHVFTGSVEVPTPAAGDNSVKAATTAFVKVNTAGGVAFRTGTPNALTMPQWTLRQPTFSATPLFNNGGGLWDGTTYTVKTAGLYLVVFQSGVVYPSTGALTIGQGESFIYVNGAAVAKHGYNDPFWAGPFTQTKTLVHTAYLAVNDLITLRILTGNWDGVNLSTDNAYTWLSVIRLGA
jgi:hypothetical protein